MKKYRNDMLINWNGIDCRILYVNYDEYLEEEYCSLLLYKIKEDRKQLIIIDKNCDDTIRILEN